MGFIYKIENDINEKIYIGKTLRSIQIRWSEHKKNAKNNKLDLPLYKAMRKYGIEHFFISIIEECEENEIDDREIYWISKYESYKKGYNCTGGGEGGIKEYTFLPEIIERYQAGECLNNLCKEYHYNYNNVSREFAKRNIPINTKAGPEKLSRKVAAIDPNTKEIVNIYPSISEAGRQICKPGKNPRAVANHIGKNKNTGNVSHGFIWQTKGVLANIDELYELQEKNKNEKEP